MGYYSTFTVEADPEGALNGPLTDILSDASGGYHFEYWSGAARLYDAKWYSFDDDMKTVSRAFPNVEFTVTQEGEDGEGKKYTLQQGQVLKRFVRGWVED